MRLFRAVAEGGFSAAQVALGEFYLYGNHVEKDQAEAELWYMQAAKQGNVIAEHNLGTMYYQEGDLQKAKVWLTRAADKQYADAAQNLAALYFDEADLYQAEQYVDLAISLGNDSARRMRTGIKRQQLLEEQIQESIYSTGFSGY